MPTPTVTAPSAASDAAPALPASALPVVEDHAAPSPLVSAKVIASKGRMSLRVDVTKLHEYLDTLGIERDTTYKRFASLPAHPTGNADIAIDTRTHKVAARFLGRTGYAKDPTGAVLPGILECDLNAVYSTPPTRATLDVIAASVRDATMELIAWYQPVEISVQIVTKRGSTTHTPAATPASTGG